MYELNSLTKEFYDIVPHDASILDIVSSNFGRTLVLNVMYDKHLSYLSILFEKINKATITTDINFMWTSSEGIHLRDYYFRNELSRIWTFGMVSGNTEILELEDGRISFLGDFFYSRLEIVCEKMSMIEIPFEKDGTFFWENHEEVSQYVPALA